MTVWYSLNEYSIFWLLVHLIDIWRLSSILLLWLVLLWKLYTSFCLNTCSQFFWGTYLGVECLDHVIILCLLLKSHQIVFHSSWCIYYSYQQDFRRVSGSPHHFWHFCFCPFLVLIMAPLVGNKMWHIVVVFLWVW